MKKILVTMFIVASLALVGGLTFLTPQVSADAKSQMTDALGKVNDGNTTDLNNGITTGINMMLFLIGAISVIVIIIGGIRYVVSGGDQSAVQSAKNTILYAVIGLVVAILAYAIVNFVVTQFTQ